MLACTKCFANLPDAALNRENAVRCVSCGSRFDTWTFSALYRQRSVDLAAELQPAEDDALCYEHATKKAVAACSRCGRFVCALCRMDAEGAVFCPLCLVSGISKQTVSTMENYRTLYDSIALGAAALPLATVYLAVFTGPIAFFLTLRFWNRPTSLVPRSKWRLIVALLVSLFETLGLVAAIVFFVWALRNGFGGKGVDPTP